MWNPAEQVMIFVFPLIKTRISLTKQTINIENVVKKRCGSWAKCTTGSCSLFLSVKRHWAEKEFFWWHLINRRQPNDDGKRKT